MTLSHIKSMTIVGNAMSDQPIFNAIDSFVHDESNTIEERAEAVCYIDNVMGISEKDNRQAKVIVDEYLAGC